VHVAVVGGAGFIGAALVERLLADGHRVDVIDDLSTGSLGALADARATAETGALSIHTLSVHADAVDDLGVLFERRQIERVVHVAPTSVDDLVGSCAAAGVAKLVTTAESEQLLPARQRHKVDFTVLRLGEVAGFGARSGVVAHLLAERTDASAPGADVVFLSDVVEAFMLALDRGGGLVLDVTSGEVTPTTVLAALLGVPAPMVSSDAVAAGDLKRTALYLGWKPTVPLERLRRLVS
jgi:UDP-glucose 4-epimerase